LAIGAQVVAMQKGCPVDAKAARGPIRLGLLEKGM